MINTSHLSQILLGLVISFAGMSGYLLYHNPPPIPPGLAGSFQDVFFRSGVSLADSVQLISSLRFGSARS